MKKSKIKHGKYKIMRENDRIFKEMCEPHNNDRRRTLTRYFIKQLKRNKLI